MSLSAALCPGLYKKGKSECPCRNPGIAKGDGGDDERINLVKGGIIEIQSNVEHSILILKIRNSGQLVDTPSKRGGRKGVGLINTKERLKLIYGEAASFRIYNENNKFVVTEVKIPQRI